MEEDTWASLQWWVEVKGLTLTLLKIGCCKKSALGVGGCYQWRE